MNWKKIIITQVICITIAIIALLFKKPIICSLFCAVSVAAGVYGVWKDNHYFTIGGPNAT